MRNQHSNPIKIKRSIIDLNEVSHITFADSTNTHNLNSVISFFFKNSESHLSISFEKQSDEEYFNIKKNLERYIKPIDISLEYTSLPPDNYPKNK